MSAQRTFTVEAKEICPNLSTILEVPERFGKNEGGGGGGGMMGMMNMMPAGAGPPPGAGPMGMPAAGGPAAGGGQAAGNPQANRNLNFVIICELVNPGQWNVTRRWKAGGTDIDKLEVNGIDLVPLSSN